MSEIIFKDDKYKKTRGGYSRLLDITCDYCKKHICFYQKDGPNNLRRLYIDRIFEPKVSISSKNLFCPDKHLIGIKIVYNPAYNPEKRPAFRLFAEAIRKKIVKSK